MSDLTEYARDPWEYVPGNEHHGPYVTTSWGKTVADCYTMSNPEAASVRNGGTSYPINHCGDDAEAHARLIAAAPELLEMLVRLDAEWTKDIPQGPEAGVVSDSCSPTGIATIHPDHAALWKDVRAAIAKATGEAPDAS